MVKMRWVDEARRHIGLTEIKGPQHNPEIVAMWKAIKRGGIKDDETPWCAGFIGGVLEAVQIKSTRSAAARSYLKWGEILKAPIPGCIVILERGPVYGHVFFVLGQDKWGNLVGIGGNQSNMVSIRSFPRKRVLGYRWPNGVIKPIATTLPLMSSTGVSTREA